MIVQVLVIMVVLMIVVKAALIIIVMLVFNGRSGNGTSSGHSIISTNSYARGVIL